MADDQIIDDTKKPHLGEVAIVEKDIDIFSGWLTRLENPDAILREQSQGQGIKLYEELFRDSQVHSQHQTRTLALQACEWEVEPASDKSEDARIADFVKKVLESTNYDRACKNAMQAVVTGYKPIEIMWEASEGDYWISEFRARRPSRFLFDTDFQLRMLTPQNVFDGEVTPKRKFFTWSFGGFDHNPYGTGLGYQLYWYVWFKKNGIKWWMVFAEKFGMGIPVGKYPDGLDSKSPEVQKLMSAIKAMREQTGIAIPISMTLEIMEAKRAGDATYEEICQYMDRAIAKILIGQTLTSEEGKSGSLSLGQVHNDVRHEIVKADADDLCEAQNESFIRWLVDYNFGPRGHGKYPRVWRRTEPEKDLKSLAERDKILLVDMGHGDYVPRSYITETYNIPLAKEGEPTLSIPEKAPAPQVTGSSPKQLLPPQAADEKSAEVSFSEAEAINGQAKIDAMGDEASVRSQAVMEAFLKPVFDLIEGAASLEEIGERIFELYPSMDSRAFQELLCSAMMKSAMTGYIASEAEHG